MCSQFTSSEYHSLYTIGSNVKGQQCDGTTTNVRRIKLVKSIQKRKIRDIKTFRFGATYIILDDGSYFVAGYNKDGQLGLKHSSDAVVEPVYINNHPIQIISNGVSAQHAIITKQNNSKLYATGYNAFCQCGVETESSCITQWTEINFNKNIKSIAVGQCFSNCLTENGEIHVVGINAYGCLGISAEEHERVKVLKKINMKRRIIELCCGSAHNLCIDEHYELWSWGRGLDGALGHGGTVCVNAPKKLTTITFPVDQIVCGEKHSVILSKQSRKVYCFGRNNWCQCGNGSTENVYSPQINVTLKDKKIEIIKCGRDHNMVKTDENEYFLWGFNANNQCLVINNFGKDVKRPTKFDQSPFYDRKQKIVDIYPGCNETRIVTKPCERIIVYGYIKRCNIELNSLNVIPDDIVKLILSFYV